MSDFWLFSNPTGGGAASYVGKGAVAHGGSNTPGLPSGVVANDDLIIVLAGGNGMGGFSTPSGWARINSSIDANLNGYWKVAVGGDDLSGFNAVTAAEKVCFAWRRSAPSGDPIETFSVASPSASPLTAPSLTASDQATLVFVAWSSDQDDGGGNGQVTFGTPTGPATTEREKWSVYGADSNGSVGIWSGVKSGAGASGTPSVSTTYLTGFASARTLFFSMVP